MLQARKTAAFVHPLDLFSRIQNGARLTWLASAVAEDRQLFAGLRLVPARVARGPLQPLTGRKLRVEGAVGEAVKADRFRPGAF
jgi:hypothetical protein